MGCILSNLAQQTAGPADEQVIEFVIRCSKNASVVNRTLSPYHLDKVVLMTVVHQHPVPFDLSGGISSLESRGAGWCEYQLGLNEHTPRRGLGIELECHEFHKSWLI